MYAILWCVNSVFCASLGAALLGLRSFFFGG